MTLISATSFVNWNAKQCTITGKPKLFDSFSWVKNSYSSMYKLLKKLLYVLLLFFFLFLNGLTMCAMDFFGPSLSRGWWSSIPLEHRRMTEPLFFAACISVLFSFKIQWLLSVFWKINAVCEQGQATVQRHLGSSRTWFHNTRSNLKAICSFSAISGSSLQVHKEWFIGMMTFLILYIIQDFAERSRKGDNNGGQLFSRKIFVNTLQI